MDSPVRSKNASKKVWARLVARPFELFSYSLILEYHIGGGKWDMMTIIISTIQSHLQSFPQFLPLDNFLDKANLPLVAPSTILHSGKFQSDSLQLPDNAAPRFGASTPEELLLHLANTPVRRSSRLIPSRTSPVSPGSGPHRERKSPHPQIWIRYTT